ncbi:HNH endonuclease signature motif containing protein [Paenimyroides baculatum]|uniref:HNH endonuclease n=1 Tax=Paenimyroides baculatum TaxID=2608000 RepID=A0A5M6CPI0_9FLAO|nr:HNH endonuclease signature motif containing protein [Paenimyroides baculatum]KAA5535902.1 HNH endonuclease [Paenimyroides baculatum]
MKNNEIELIINNLIKTKEIHLSTWKKVRWQGGRVYYEIKSIEQEIQNFDLQTKILYLEKLLNGKYIIQDNLPHSAPDVTQEFKSSLVVIVSDLKIQFLNSKPKVSTSSKKRRPPIPHKIKTLLQKEVKSKCPFCISGDVDHFQFHHIDENPENNDFENLLMICPTCHSKITKGDIQEEEVLIKKRELYIN